MRIPTITDVLLKHNGVIRVIKLTKKEMPMKVTLLKDKNDYDVRLNPSGFMFEAKNNAFCGKAW